MATQIEYFKNIEVSNDSEVKGNHTVVGDSVTGKSISLADSIVSTAYYNDIRAAIEAQDGLNKNIWITENQTLSNLTVGDYSGVTIKVLAGTTLTISFDSSFDFNLCVEDGGQILLDQDCTINGNIRSEGNTSGVVAFDAVTGDETLTISGGIDAGLWQIFGGSLSVAGEPLIYSVHVSWFGDITTDIGQPILDAIDFTATWGGVILLPAGKYPCTTPIHWTNNTSTYYPTFTIEGTGYNVHQNGGYNGFDGDYGYGTIIDGSGLSDDVINFDTYAGTGSPFTRNLLNFSVIAGTGHGFYLKGGKGKIDQLAAYGADSTGKWGFYCEDIYNSIGHIVTMFNDGGFYSYRMNATLIQQIIARHNNGDWAVTLEDGKAMTIQSLYIESNYGSVLRTGNSGYPVIIETLYAENNNRGANRDYGILIGDSSLGDGISQRGVTIKNIHYSIALDQEFTEAFIGIDNVRNFTLEKTPLTNGSSDETFFKFITGASVDVVNMNEVWRNQNFSAGRHNFDLSEAPDYCTINFQNCTIQTEAISLPTSNLVSILVNGGTLSNFSLDNELISITRLQVSSNTKLKSWQQVVEVDTSGGDITITLPNKYTAYGEYFILNNGLSNNITVTTDDANIWGSVNSTIGPLGFASYTHLGAANRWYKTAEGTK